jgi:hypothetical protein
MALKHMSSSTVETAVLHTATIGSLDEVDT